MELFDIYDENGTPTGEIIDRDIVHAQGLWHKTVHIWIINYNAEILMQLRAPDKVLHPNKWDTSAAGHISAGETPIEGCIRELHEELGIKASPEDFTHLYTNKEIQLVDDIINHEFQEIYLLRQKLDATDFTFKDHEVTAVKWLPFAELSRMVAEKSAELIPVWDYYARLLTELEKCFTNM